MCSLEKYHITITIIIIIIIVVDESADSVVLDAVQKGARHRTRSRFEACQAILVEYRNQDMNGFYLKLIT